MDLEELKTLKEDLKKLYEEEKQTYELNQKADLKEIYEAELNDISREQRKVDYLIEVYQNTDKEYIVMKLERLYMMLIANLNEEAFDNLAEDKQLEIFDEYFPDEWVLKYNITTKENMLIDAICNNQVIVMPKAKKQALKDLSGE